MKTRDLARPVAFLHRSRAGRALAWVLFACAAAAIGIALHLGLPNIPDRDGLYHFRHAALYVERGPFSSAFPWTAYSVIRTYASDIWYGFHLLLTPFTLGADPVRGVKLAGAFDLTAMLLLLFAAVRLARLRLTPLWPFAVLVFSPFLLYRLLMTRPHVISMGLAALVLTSAATGSLWGLGLASFGIAFVHLSFFWVVVLIVGVVVLVRQVTENRWAWREAGVAALGLVAGWLLRPNPIGAAKLVYVQIVQLALEKQKGVELLFGADLLSGARSLQQYPETFLQHFAPAAVLWAAAAVVLLAAAMYGSRLAARERALLWSSFALSGIAFAIMMQFSIRAVDLWAVFSVLLAAEVYSLILRRPDTAGDQFPTRRQALVAMAIGALLLAGMFWRGFSEYDTKMTKLGYSPYRFKGAADWLADNSAPGTIVFHAHWDLFPDLFFWNTKDYYIGGMDPIFQYAYSPSLYWKAHHLWSGQFSSYTCGTEVCAPQMGEDTYTVLTRDFKAGFLVLERRRHPALYAYALGDPRFHLGFEDEEVVVFRLDSAQPPVAGPSKPT
jgi:hypothetical protein